MATSQKSAGQIRSENENQGQGLAESRPSILGVGTLASESTVVGGLVSDAVAKILSRVATPGTSPCEESDSSD